MENKNETFEYTYSSAQQAEVEKIRKKYLPKEENKMEQLRKLDQDVTKPGTLWAIVVGVIGCLVFGFGMCCCLTWADTMLVPGIVFGILGIGIMGLAMPVYKNITQKQREKLAPQILALTEELSK